MSLSAHSTLNIESLVALGFLLAIFVRSRRGSYTSSGHTNGSVLVYFGLCCTILAVYWRALDAPFLYDDYTHITDARNATWHSIATAFGPVEHKPGLFFRPFGFLVYWLNYRVAGEDPRLWHAASLLFHAINCCLLYALCRALRFSLPGSVGAAMLFAVSGVAVESAMWIDARFDPMATCLVLASLLSVCRFLDSGRWVWIVSACVLGVLACASKESAFCLPLLVGCLWFLREDRRRLAAAFACVGAVVGGLFLYRWWALGGIGGYQGSGFSPVRMLNAVLVRDWTILFFPINWSGSLGWMLKAFLVATPLVLILCVVKARVPRRVFLGCIGLTVAAALPVQHLLLIGIDLANTRYLYLPLVGWALLWGAIFAAIPSKGWRGLVMGWMLVWHLLMVRHNAAFWLQASEEARAVCIDFAHTVTAFDGQAIVGGLPQRKNGAVFLANGFPECVEMNGHVPAGRVTVYGRPNFNWNPATGRVE